MEKGGRGREEDGAEKKSRKKEQMSRFRVPLRSGEECRRGRGRKRATGGCSRQSGGGSGVPQQELWAGLIDTANTAQRQTRTAGGWCAARGSFPVHRGTAVRGGDSPLKTGRR